MPIAKERIEELQIKKLLHCVRTNDYDQIRKLCVKGIEYLINYNEPKDGITALILAACMNNDKMLKYLLDLGAHPNIVDFNGKSALMRAAELGHVQCMEILSQQTTCDSNLIDVHGKNVLFYCLSAPTLRHDRCMQIALEMGTNVNNISKEGVPILVEACKKSQEYREMCLLLIRHNCDLNLCDTKSERTALQNAASSGSWQVCRAILEKGVDPNYADKHKQTAAHDASKGNHFKVLCVLSAYGAHFDVYDLKNNNPIHYAAQVNAGACARFLATRGCNPKVKNLDGQTPKQIAKELKAKDASKNISKGEKQYAKLSKQSNEQGGINWSIRLYDYMCEHQERIRELFIKNNTNNTNSTNNTNTNNDNLDKKSSSRFIQRDVFVDILCQEGFENLIETDEMKKMILAHEKDNNEIDYELFLLGKKYISKQFLMSSFEAKQKKSKKKGGKSGKRGGKTKIIMPICVMESEGVRQEYGEPPLIYQPKHVLFTDINRFNRDKPPKHPLEDDSCWYLKYPPDKLFVHLSDATNRGDLQTLLDAFKRGLCVDIRDKYYKTPLMIAAAHGDLKTCKFLIECGADVNLKDNFKWTPLHHACHSGQLDIVKLLIQSNANINALSLTSTTPFMCAIESSSYEIVEYFLLQMNTIKLLQQENMQGKTAFDLAKDYADPRVYYAIKAKLDTLPKPKDTASNKKQDKKKKKENKKTKNDKSSNEDNDSSFLPTIQTQTLSLRRNSFSRAEQLLKQELMNTLHNQTLTNGHIAYRPLNVWTEQETSEQLLEQKKQLRDRFGWQIDFPDFKMPFIKSLNDKIQKLTLQA